MASSLDEESRAVLDKLTGPRTGLSVHHSIHNQLLSSETRILGDGCNSLNQARGGSAQLYGPRHSCGDTTLYLFVGDSAETHLENLSGWRIGWKE